MTSYTEEEKRKAVEMVEECVGSVMHATSKSGYPSRLTLYQWLDEWAAYFATVFRLTWSTLAISDLERPAASIDRISFTVSRGTVISSILPGRARQSNRPGKPYGEGRAPGPPGAALLLQDFSLLAAQRPALNHPLRGWRQTALQSHPSDRY